MKKRKRSGARQRAARESQQPGPAQAPPVWMEPDGLHIIAPGSPPSSAELDELTRRYQEQIRRSPLWQQMVEEFGLAEAERLLQQFRAELR